MQSGEVLNWDNLPKGEGTEQDFEPMLAPAVKCAVCMSSASHSALASARFKSIKVNEKQADRPYRDDLLVFGAPNRILNLCLRQRLSVPFACPAQAIANLLLASQSGEVLNRLKYGKIRERDSLSPSLLFWRTEQDSNLRHQASEACALSS